MPYCVVGTAAVVDISNVLYPTGGILLCLKKVKDKDADPAIALFTCIRLIPRLLAIKQQIHIKKIYQFITVCKDDVIISVL